MKTGKIIGGILGIAALILLSAVMLVEPTRAEDQTKSKLTVHVGMTVGKKYTLPGEGAIEASGYNEKILAVSQTAVTVATGSATTPTKTTTEYLYTGLKPGTTTVHLSRGTDAITPSEVIVTIQDHKWSKKYTIDEPSTCTEHGIKSIHCSVDGCDAIKPGSKKKVKLAPHPWKDEYTVDREPTYFRAGVKSIYCKACGKKKPNSSVKIPKLKLRKASFKSIENPKKGFIKITIKLMRGANGYDFLMSKSKDMKNPKKASLKGRFVNLKGYSKGTTLYFRVRAVRTKRSARATGPWSKVTAFTVKK